MCGIAACGGGDVERELAAAIAPRGLRRARVRAGNYVLLASVLPIRSNNVAQPHSNAVYNGEIYGVDDDTRFVCEVVGERSRWSEFFRMSGGFAFIGVVDGVLAFGRDYLGRKSLLWNSESVVSSVACEGVANFEEVPPGCVFTIANGELKSLFDFRPAALSLRRMAPRETLTEALVAAVARRVEGLSHVSLFYSGGLDSLILYAILSRIDHVKFEALNLSFSGDSALDRKRAIRLKYPFVRIDSSAIEAFEVSPSVLAPKTVDRRMDINLATCVSELSRKAKHYVCITGSGADELFGGYAQKRGREFEIQYMSSKTLSRDDRVAGSWTRELRTPFLDDRVVAHALHGEADVDKKRLLEVALELTGLPREAVSPKKAMQFGSHCSKVLENGYGLNGFDLTKLFLSPQECRKLVSECDRLIERASKKFKPLPFKALGSVKACDALVDSIHKAHVFGDQTPQTIGHGVCDCLKAFEFVKLRVLKTHPTMRVVQSKVVLKPKHTGDAVPAHVDDTFIYTLPTSGVAYWIPLVSASKENGCVEVVAGSHLAEETRGAPKFCVRDFGAKATMEGGTKQFSEYVKNAAFRALPMEAGSALRMHPRLLHRSSRNHSNTHRYALTLHLVSTEASFVNSNWLCSPRRENG